MPKSNLNQSNLVPISIKNDTKIDEKIEVGKISKKVTSGDFLAILSGPHVRPKFEKNVIKHLTKKNDV